MNSYFIEETRERVIQGLDAWRWLQIPAFTSYKVSAMGDLFLMAEDGKIWFLDTLEGKCSPAFSSMAHFDQVMATTQGQDHYLMAGMLLRAEREGMKLQPGQCFDWKLAPVVGGKIEFENLSQMDFVVSLHIAGQIHDQVRHLGPGTKISSFVMTEPPPATNS